MQRLKPDPASVPEPNPVSLVQQFVEFLEQVPGESVQPLCGRVLRKCRDLTGAEAGTIFVVRGRGRNRALEAVSVQNDVVRTRSATFVVPFGAPSIAGYVGTSGETVFVDDAYAIPPERSYKFNRGFDDKTGFRTHSILCFALRNYQEKIIGVVQLINRRGATPGAILPFLPAHEAMIAPVNHLAGRAIERARNLERIAEQNRKLRDSNRMLRAERQRVERQQQETESAFMVSVELLAHAAELHDLDTGNHILRVNEYSYALARRAQQPKDFCDAIRIFAALHDVGKMSVDKAILHKKGRLDAAEMAEMQRHATYGYEILRNSERLAMAAEIAHCHHEKWAGTGYPSGLKGEDIPLSARIVAIADIYDALRSQRPYKPGFSHERSVEIILKGDDRIDPIEHFDPWLLKLFAESQDEFARIWDTLSESPEAKAAE